MFWGIKMYFSIYFILYLNMRIWDRVEKHDFWSRFLLIHSLFLLSSFIRREEKSGKNNQSRGQKSCLSARSDLNTRLCIIHSDISSNLYQFSAVVQKMHFLVPFWINLHYIWCKYSIDKGTVTPFVSGELYHAQFTLYILKQKYYIYRGLFSYIIMNDRFWSMLYKEDLL